MRFSMTGWVGGLSSLLLACSTVTPSGVATEGLTGSIGVLHIERAEEDGAELHAAFARYHGIDGESVLTLLGTSEPAALGQCVELTETPTLDLTHADVELLDVGTMRVGIADTEAELTARTFPDVASVLAGVFYAGDTTVAAPRPELDEYRFSADGGAEVGGFEVWVTAPAYPTGVRLRAEDGTGAALSGHVTELEGSTGDLTLSWDAGDPEDVIELELVSGGLTLVCASADEGSFELGQEWLSRVPADEAARLSVRRVRSVPFEVSGMDVAYARVAAARGYALAIR